jgi:hypothetical protein
MDYTVDEPMKAGVVEIENSEDNRWKGILVVVLFALVTYVISDIFVS